MLKSCAYCGKIHDSKYDCGCRPKRQKQGNDKDRFRWSKAWQRKRTEIKERDKYLCQLCIRNLHGSVNQYNYDYLEVHHAISLEAGFNKRLDNGNLITTCEPHHEMMERGEIPLDVVLEIIAEQEQKRAGCY